MSSNPTPYQMGYDDALSGKSPTFVGSNDDRTHYQLGYVAGGEE